MEYWLIFFSVCNSMLCEGLVHRVREQTHNVRDKNSRADRGSNLWHSAQLRPKVDALTDRATSLLTVLDLYLNWRTSWSLNYSSYYLPLTTPSPHPSHNSHVPSSPPPLYKSDQPFSSTEIYKTSENASNRYPSVMVSSTLFKTPLPLKLDRTKRKPRPRSPFWKYTTWV